MVPCVNVYLSCVPHQRPILRSYPAPISLTALAYAIGAIFLFICGLFFVEKRSDWVINETTGLIAVGYAVCTLPDIPTTPPKTPATDSVPTFSNLNSSWLFDYPPCWIFKVLHVHYHSLHCISKTLWSASLGICAAHVCWLVYRVSSTQQ